MVAFAPLRHAYSVVSMMALTFINYCSYCRVQSKFCCKVLKGAETDPAARNW